MSLHKVDGSVKIFFWGSTESEESHWVPHGFLWEMSLWPPQWEWADLSRSLQWICPEFRCFCLPVWSLHWQPRSSSWGMWGAHWGWNPNPSNQLFSVVKGEWFLCKPWSWKYFTESLLAWSYVFHNLAVQIVGRGPFPFARKLLRPDHWGRTVSMHTGFQQYAPRLPWVRLPCG